MRNDPYAELGVSRRASPDDIRKAYRKLVKELHPDARPGDKAAEERFKRVTAAFDLLSDADKRRRFDRGEIDAEGHDRGFAPGGGDEAFSDFGDILNGMFGDAGRAGGFRARGEDVRYKLDVGFVEAATGARKRVVMGDGRSLDIVIPEGARSGQVLRLRGQGRPARGGGAAGDALVELEIGEHAHFRREGDDIHLDLPVTLQEAVLGGKARAPTLTGPVTITIPKGSNTGSVLRLRGKGVRGERGFGDQLVRLLVTLPEKPDAALARFLEDWSPETDYDPRRKLERS